MILLRESGSLDDLFRKYGLIGENIIKETESLIKKREGITLKESRFFN